MRSTLEEHRRRLTQIAPDDSEVTRLANSLNPHLSRFGFRKPHERLRRQMVDVILETQEHKPFFWIDSVLPYCWNEPKDWGKTHIVYQWGHLNPRNQVGDSGEITDLCLMSPRCNNHIQSSLPLPDVQEYFKGAAVGARIEEVLGRRRLLFESAAWNKLMSELMAYRKPEPGNLLRSSRSVSENT